MLLRVLGPLELGPEHAPVPLRGARLRTLLAALAVRRRSVTSPDDLIDALWSDTPPASAAKLIQVYVSQLRTALPPGIAIATRPAGYRLEAEEREVDADQFERLVVDGRAALRAGNAALAANSLRRALALWRGPAFADVRYEEFARREAERLDDLRLAAAEDRFDAELRLGRHADVLPELRGFVAEDATRERLGGLAMLAAYRSGGSGAALAIYAEVAAALEAAVGAEPGDVLRDLRERVLAGDASLDAPMSQSDGDILPAPPNPLVGRARELDDIRRLLVRGEVRLLTLTGAGGSGKSRLALEIARAMSGEYANGAVLVELAALREAELVVPTVARALGLDPGRETVEDVGQAISAREQLLVLDNIEHLREIAPRIVRLLALAPRLVVLVTSRVVLHVSGEHVYPVSPLAEADAVQLFEERARAQDPAFLRDEASRALVAEICRRLDGLPLPIELAAARVRALGLPGLRDRLAFRLRVLTGGPRDLPARQQTLRETIAWSVNLVPPAQVAMLAALSIFPGSWSAAAAEAVAKADDEALIALVDHSLVQVSLHDGERRYRLLETVREYAAELLGDERADVEARLVAWVRELVRTAELNAAGAPQERSLGRLDIEVDTLREALRIASTHDDPSAELEIAGGVWRYWWIRGRLAEGGAVLDGVLARRGPVSSPEGARVARAAASLAWSRGDLGRARPLADQALQLAAEAGDAFEHVCAHNLLGVLANSEARLDDAVHHLEEAARIAEEADLVGLTETARLNLGIAHLDAGRLDEARRLFEGVLAYREAEGLSEGIGFARINLGETEFEAGRLAEAEVHYRVAAQAFAAVGFHSRHANALQGLAAVEAATGRAEAAARRLGAAASMLSDTGWEADGTALAPTAAKLARAALGDTEFERLLEEGTRSGPPP